MRLQKGQEVEINTALISVYIIKKIRYCHKQRGIMITHSIYWGSISIGSVERTLEDVIKEFEIRGLENIKIDGKTIN